MSQTLETPQSDLNLLKWALDLNVKERKKTHRMNFHGWEIYINKGKATGPYFLNQLMRRIHEKRAINIVFTGEAGSGKTYLAIQIARLLYPRLVIEDVVYGFADYYKVLTKKRIIGSPIVLDEPQDAIDHREWYKEVNKSIVKTITSQRFMVRPLFIPIINTSLIDKTIRNYLVQYQVECVDRGFARVFSLSPSQKEDKTYFNFICNLRYGLMDKDLCNKPSCLFCKSLSTCNIFRAEYERKKAEAVYERVEQSREEAIIKESQELTDMQVVEKVYPFREQFTKDGKINVSKLKIVAKMKPVNVHLAHNRAYDIRALLEYRYPDDFSSE